MIVEQQKGEMVTGVEELKIKPTRRCNVMEETLQIQKMQEIEKTLQAQRVQEFENMTKLKVTVIADYEAKKEKIRVVDVKGVRNGKPTAINSDMKTSSSWSFKLNNILENVVIGIKDRKNPQTNSDHRKREGRRNEQLDIKNRNEQLDVKNASEEQYVVLNQTNGNETLDMMQAKERDGFEAWQTKSHRAALQIVTWTQNTLGTQTSLNKECNDTAECRTERNRLWQHCRGCETPLTLRNIKRCRRCGGVYCDGCINQRSNRCYMCEGAYQPLRTTYSVEKSGSGTDRVERSALSAQGTGE